MTAVLTCPNCGGNDVRRHTRIARGAWPLLIGGIGFAPFTAGLSLALPLAAVMLREPWWECEGCWHHGAIDTDHTVAFAWSHKHSH